MLRIVGVFVALLAVMLLAACSLSPQVQLTPLAPQPVSTQSPLPTPGRSPLPTPPAGERPSASVPIPPGAETAVRAAIDDLTTRLKIASEAVQVASVSAVDWSDTSLGCPQPGMFYAQIIVEGYKIVLSTGDQQIEYHSDQSGRVVTCSK